MQGIELGPADLAALSSNAPPDVRAEIAGKVAGFFARAEQDDANLPIAGEIARYLLKDPSIPVRQTFAESSSKAIHLPNDVAMGLARDLESIAVPVLSRSPVFEDEDLMVIINEGGPLRQVAVARRPEVSDRVAGVIADSANEAAVTTLVENPGAAIGETTFGRILDGFGHKQSVQRPMANRATLPETIAGRLMGLVSEDLRDLILRRHPLPVELIEGLKAQRHADVTQQDAERDAPASQQASADELIRLEGLTPLLVLRAACEGDMAFVTDAFARLGGLEPVIVNTLLLDRDWLGLRSLFVAAGFQQRYFSAFRTALESYQEVGVVTPERRSRHAKNVLARFLTTRSLLPERDLDEFVRLMGRIGEMSVGAAALSNEIHQKPAMRDCGR